MSLSAQSQIDDFIKGREMQQQLKEYRVARVEVQSLKPSRTVYEQQNGLWFLASAPIVMQHLEQKIKSTEKQLTLHAANAANK